MARDESDDEALAGRKKTFEPRLLDSLSIAELEHYIVDLKGEISRVEEAITVKQRVRAGADSLFGKKPG